MEQSMWSAADWERLQQAFATAIQIHNGQERRGSPVPYIAHPMAVASIVLEHGGTPAEVIAALLHDTAEDGGGEAVLERLEREFGGEVAGIVRGCSDSLVADRHHKAPWIERKQQHFAELHHASRSVALVTAADKLHNARSLAATLRANGDAAWSSFKAGRPGTASWLNQIETWFGILSLQAIRRGSFESVRALVAAIERFTREWNAGATPFKWVKTPDQILAKAVRRTQADSGAGH